MVRTQIQLPDELHEQLRVLAEAHEWSLAEAVRRGAELLQMTYRSFLDLLATHRIPSLDYEEGWLERGSCKR